MKPKFDLELVQESMFGPYTMGGCLACGEVSPESENGLIESDAWGYPCAACGEKRFGSLEEMLVRCPEVFE